MHGGESNHRKGRIIELLMMGNIVALIGAGIAFACFELRPVQIFEHPFLAADGTSPEESTGIPGTRDDKEFDRIVVGLNLEDDKRFVFHPKTGGTSIGFKVSRPDKRKSGLFLPENSATHLEGEVVSYRLSRFLGVSEIYNPVSYYTLGPNGIRRFSEMLRSNERNSSRRKNTKSIKNKIGASPQELLGVFKFRHKRESQPVDALARNGLNTRHSFVAFLHGDGPMPAEQMRTFKGVIPDKPDYPSPFEKERILAAQFSTILVLDALCGQWDRFSGGNIEVYAHKDGRLQFIARDNGGANLNWGSAGRNWYRKYLRWVTRFDPNLIAELRLLHDFLSGSRTEYKGYLFKSELEEDMGFISSRSFKEFQWRLTDFLERNLPACEKKYGRRCYFKMPSDESQGREARTETPVSSVAHLE